ncbi:MAG: MBG domain-containing protein [Oscillospiraceae bacterium]
MQGTTLTAGQTLGTVKLQVTMTGWDENGDGIDEYSGDSGIDYLTVTVVDKESQPPGNGGGVGQPGFSLQGPTAVTYGQSISFQTTGGAGTGKVTFWVEPRSGRGAATIDSNGVLQGTQTGSVLVYAKKDGDDRYESIQADPIEVTIRPAKLTIQVHNKTAAVGDPVPALTQADYTVSGLVGRDTLAKAPTLSYGAAPNLSLPGVVPIQAAGAVARRSGNSHDPNITYVPGTLTIRGSGLSHHRCRDGERSGGHGLPGGGAGTTVTLTVRPAESSGWKS